MRKPQAPIHIHRLARLTLWARAILVWAAAVLLGLLIPDTRRERQRRSALSLGKLAYLVRNLMIAHIALHVRNRPQRAWRDFSRTGFRRRRPTRNPLRAIAGARLRRFLLAGSVTERLARLAKIMSDIDAYARRFLLRRALHGVTRLSPILMVSPPHDVARALASPAAICADTS
jgi:hypothetical protein